MVWESANLRTRQFVRRDTEIPARVEVHQDQAGQLRFSFADTHSRMVVIDVSEGGLGLRSSAYLPRNARLIIRVRPEGDSAREIVVQAIVRRTAMIDIKPTYQVGLQFIETDAEDQKALLAMANAARAAAEGDTANVG